MSMKTEFTPVVRRLKIDLASHATRGGGVEYIYI